MAIQTQLLIYDDYRTLPDDGNRYEIIGGQLVMSPSPTSLPVAKSSHARIIQ